MGLWLRYDWPVPSLSWYSRNLLTQGIIGANPGNEFNISGVAFGASLSAYRVYGCTGDTRDDS